MGAAREEGRARALQQKHPRCLLSDHVQKERGGMASRRERGEESQQVSKRTLCGRSDCARVNGPVAQRAQTFTKRRR